MATLKRKLTVRVVKSIKLGTTDTFVWDTEIPGFGLRVRIARQWAAEVQQGRDPGDERSEAAKALTIAQFADRYMAEHARPKKQPRSFRSDESNLRNHMLPALGPKKVASFTFVRLNAWSGKIRAGHMWPEGFFVPAG